MPPLTVPSNVHYIIQVYKKPISEKQITYSPRFVVVDTNCCCCLDNSSNNHNHRAETEFKILAPMGCGTASASIRHVVWWSS
jgi:hypothetical protein